jgi:hypothetical protein
LRWFIAGEDKSIDEFGVINGASDLLDDLDVSKVNCVCILVLGVNDLDLKRMEPRYLEDGIDSNGGKDISVGADDLGGQ